MSRSFLRARQRIVTRIFPHNGNRRYIKSKGYAPLVVQPQFTEDPPALFGEDPTPAPAPEPQ